MLETLRDLYAHQEWADAEHWSAIESYPPALSDDELRKRLQHLHLVQRGFLKIFKSEPVDLREEMKNELSLSDLRSVARAYHKEVIPFLQTVAPERLEEKLIIPWFPAGFSPTFREAAMQAVMHSLYHRGQNAARIKQLGSKPPLTDYIAWIYKGRPAPAWTD
jgi:uncharacterized damage-inducible protein DinB